LHGEIPPTGSMDIMYIVYIILISHDAASVNYNLQGGWQRRRGRTDDSDRKAGLCS